MTVLYPERFHQARPAGFDGLFDWDFLKGAFGPVIMPMDLDGVVERNGRFLVFETKEPGKLIPRGQEISLKALCSTGIFTIFIVYGKTADALTRMEEWHAKREVVHEPVTPDIVWTRANDWYRHVSSLPKLARDDLPSIAAYSLAASQSMNEVVSLAEKLKAATVRVDWLAGQIQKMREQFDLRPKDARKAPAIRQPDLFGGSA